MPERPDLAYVIPRLREAVVGRTIASVTLGDPVVLRLGARGTPEDLLVGQTVCDVRRRLHFVVFDLDGDPDLTLAIHPMLAGRFRLEPPDARTTKDTCLTLGLGPDLELRYRDDKRMGKVYVMPTAQLASIPGFAKVGVDVLDPKAFTVPVLKRILAKRRDQLKVFLLDKAAVDAFGNAYADEALFAAGLHPKRRCRELSDEEIARLHDAMVRTLRHATEVVASREPALDEKIRDFLVVRNRKGEPCPTCGTTIRTAGVRGHDAFFCPQCQADPKERGLVSWKR